MKSIIIFIDTNKLGKYRKNGLMCENYSYLETNKDLLISIIKPFKNVDEVTICIPELVFEELEHQQNKNYISFIELTKNKFEKIKDLPDFELKIKDINYLDFLKGKRTNFVEAYNIKLLHKPNVELKELLNDALTKKPPFNKPKKGDSGLKDAVIWKSMLNYLKKNKFNSYFLLSNDSDFNHDILKKEFYDLTGGPLQYFNDIGRLKAEIETIVKSNAQFKETIDLVNKKISVVIEKINSIKDNVYLTIYCPGPICEIEKLNEYQDIRKESNKFYVSAELEVVFPIPDYKGDVDWDIQPILVELEVESGKIKKITSEHLTFYGEKELVLNEESK